MSIAYTIAETQRTDMGWQLPDPSQALQPQGRAARGLVEAFVAAAAGLEMATLIAQLNPARPRRRTATPPSFS